MRITKCVVAYFFIVVFISGFLFTGCSGPADQDIAETQEIVDQARNMGADEYSPRKYEEAVALLEEAKTLNNEGEYNKARDKTDLARLRAEKAIEDTERLQNIHQDE